jgi:hypothetical protein
MFHFLNIIVKLSYQVEKRLKDGTFSETVEVFFFRSPVNDDNVFFRFIHTMYYLGILTKGRMWSSGAVPEALRVELL